MRAPARGPLVRLRTRRFAHIRLFTTVALATASIVPAHAQSTDWTGAVSSNWFLAENWTAGFPRQTIDGNINTVTRNSTVVASPGALARNLAIGQNGTGILVVQGGGTLADSSGAIGNLPGGRGTVTVTGAGSNWSNAGNVVIGGQGTGTLTIQGGGSVNSGSSSIGLSQGSTGTVTVAGPDSVWVNGTSGGLNIGSFGTGTLKVENGGRVINASAFAANIGSGAGSQGMVTVTGARSTWSNTSGVNVGNLGTGTLTIAEGGLVTGPITIAKGAGSTGTLNIGAGAGNPAAAPGSLSTASVEFGAGTGTINFNHTASGYVFAPVISGGGTVNQTGPGTTILTGANTYTGGTTISAGTLRAGATGAFSPNSSFTVGSGGTLDLAGFDQTIPGLINHGVVRTGGSPAAGKGTVLTVAGDYTAGSTLALTTFLGADGSPSDLLLIDAGTATGNTGIVVTNAGGPGLLTRADGIKVVDTVNGGTTAAGAFRLGAPVVAGPYEYTLERGSVTGGNGEAWFLRSALDCGLVPTLPECVGPKPPVPPDAAVPPNPTPHFRQEVSLYAAMPVATAIYGRRIIDTLHERMGGNAQALGPGADGSYDSSPDGLWGRLIGASGRRDGNPLGIYGGGPEFDYGFGALQAGTDLYRRESQDGGRDNAGLYVAFGHGEVDVTHQLLGFSFKGGKDEFNAFSLGGYWTHFGPGDWYVDGVLQATWYDASMTGRRGLRAGETDGWGLAASLEGGYPFDLGNGWIIEPQAQLVYQTINLSGFNDGYADVRYSNEDSLAGRIGARLARSWNLEEPQGNDPAKPGEPVRQASLWLRGDFWHEFIAEPTTEFSSASGFVPFTVDGLQDNVWKLDLGGSWDFNTDATLYGNVGYEQSFDGTAHAWEGKLGVKLTW